MEVEQPLTPSINKRKRKEKPIEEDLNAQLSEAKSTKKRKKKTEKKGQDSDVAPSEVKEDSVEIKQFTSPIVDDEKHLSKKRKSDKKSASTNNLNVGLKLSKLTRWGFNISSRNSQS